MSDVGRCFFPFNLKTENINAVIFVFIVVLGKLGHDAMLFTKNDFILYYSWAIFDTVDFKLILV